jgi:hypothetical protein
MSDMSKPAQSDLFEILEGIYWDTVIPLAENLDNAGIDLLNLQIDPDAISYWESHPDYLSLHFQR